MKGISTVLMAFIFMVVTLITLLVTYFTFVGQFLNVRTILENAEVERHNIMFAQILVSSEKLVHSDSSKLFRGIFDKDKLDEDLAKGSEAVKEIISPNSIVVTEVEDLTSKTKWQSIVYDEGLIEDLDKNEFESCLSNFKIESCLPETVSGIESTVKTYPVAIRVSDEEVHLGRIKVSMMEVTS